MFQIPKTLALILNIIVVVAIVGFGVALIIRDAPLANARHATSMDTVGLVFGIVLVAIGLASAVAAVALQRWSSKRVARIRSDQDVKKSN